MRAEYDSTADFVNNYQYDELNRLQSLTQSGQTGGAAVNDKRVDYSYDALGRLQSMARYADLTGTNEVATSSYAFDRFAKLLSIEHRHGSTTLDAYSWTYDAFDRITSFTSTTGGAVTYDYDASGQLLGADRSGTTDDESYEYDENGNRTDDGFVTTDGEGNRLSENAEFQYIYDAEGNRTQRIRKSTDPAADYRTEYDWDHRNRLTAIRFFNEEDELTQRIVYSYDVFDHRTARAVYDGEDTFVEKEFRLYDDDRVVMDVNGCRFQKPRSRGAW